MTNLLIHHHLKKTGLFTQTELAGFEIKILPGGSNDVYLLKILHHPLYVIKIPRPTTRQLINRKHEYEASMITAKLGINIPFVYYDMNSGTHLSLYQADCGILNKTSLLQPHVGQEVAELLRKLHKLPTLFPGDFNIFAVISFYQKLIADKVPIGLNGILNYSAELDQLNEEFSKKTIPRCPCHCDPMFNNFLLSKDQIYLIDWEYAGNNDPCWDLANLMVEAEFNPAQEQVFLGYYFQQPINADIRRRLQVYKVLSNYLWALWCIAMLETEDKNENLYQHALRRFQLFKNSIQFIDVKSQ